MKWWNRFWKQRKQNDRVKVQFIAGCIGLVCFGYALYHGISLYRLLNTPVEYICTTSDSGGGLDAKLSQVQELDYIDAVSRQELTSVEITTQRGTLTVPCLKVSEDYLREAYGLTESSAMKTFYLNQTAYESLLNMVQSPEEKIVDVKVGYVMGEEKGTAKLISGSELLPNDSPCIFCTGDPVCLRKEGRQLRVRVCKQDLDGMQMRELGQLGIQVENQKEIEENRLQQEQKLLEVKYNLIIAVLCICFVWCLKRFGR